jgi:hypothetical protein
MRTADEKMLVNLHQSVESNTKLLGLVEDVKALHEAIDDISSAQADVLNKQAHAKFHDTIQSKLDNLVALENGATQAIRQRMITEVKDDVLATFASDKKAKDAALDAAIKALGAGPGGKLGTDVVGSYFSSAIGAYKDKYAKMPDGTDPILQQLEADVAAITTAPIIEETGGNVYDTHPIKL